jgi:hypothetical protein
VSGASDNASGLFQTVYVGQLGIFAEIIRDLEYLLGIAAEHEVDFLFAELHSPFGHGLFYLLDGIGPAMVEADQRQVTLFKVKDCLCRLSHYPV